MKCFIGLGNPGRKYRKTRHNIGFMAIDQLAERLQIKFQNSRFHGEIAEGRFNDQKVVLLKPLTYMNLSGEAVHALMDFYQLSSEQIVIAYDDMDTELGKIRLRYKGSAGGHNGIKSIIQHLGSQQFNRIRIGISRPPAGMEIVPYVLADFAKSERSLLDEVIVRSAEAMEDTMQMDFERVMAKYN